MLTLVCRKKQEELALSKDDSDSSSYARYLDVVKVRR